MGCKVLGRYAEASPNVSLDELTRMSLIPEAVLRNRWYGIRIRLNLGRSRSSSALSVRLDHTVSCSAVRNYPQHVHSSLEVEHTILQKSLCPSD
jgi:hypothetical protein